MHAVVRLVRQFPVLAFVLAAYAISWSVWIPIVILGISFNTQTGWLLYLIGSFGPSLAGLLLMGMLHGAAGPWKLLSGLWRRPMHGIWLAAAIVLPFLIMGAALATQAVLGGARPESSNPLALAMVLVGAFLRITITGGPLGEELGWRGFALPRLQTHQSALRASLLLGLVWGVWHAPLYFMPGTGQYGMAQEGQLLFSFASFLVWTLALSILLTWLYNNTAGNLLVVLLFHAGVNTAANLPSLLNAAGVAVMLNGGFTWLAALVVILIAGGKSLYRSAQPAGSGGDLTASGL